MADPITMMRENWLAERKSLEYREDQLQRSQKALNSCRDSMRRCEGIPGEKARQTLEQFKQIEKYHLNRIKELGGQEDTSAGKLTVHDLPTPKELQEGIRKNLLEAHRKVLASIRATIKRVKAMEEGENKAQMLKKMLEREAFYLQLIEPLERGSIQPVMPIVPCKGVNRDQD